MGDIGNQIHAKTKSDMRRQAVRNKETHWRHGVHVLTGFYAEDKHPNTRGDKPRS